MPTSEFWLERWEQNQIGWHQSRVNPQLEAHLLPRLADEGEVVFVPLCGKSLDMLWLAEQGCRVVGVELSSLAVRQFFDELGLAFSFQEKDGFMTYRYEDIEIYVGDYFALEPHHLAGVTTVYDRGALVAMAPEQQPAYAARFHELAPRSARVLLLTIDYGGTMQGPPFAVTESNVRNWYGPARNCEVLEETSVDDARFASRGALDIKQQVLWLTPRQGAA